MTTHDRHILAGLIVGLNWDSFTVEEIDFLGRCGIQRLSPHSYQSLISSDVYEEPN